MIRHVLEGIWSTFLFLFFLGLKRRIGKQPSVPVKCFRCTVNVCVCVYIRTATVVWEAQAEESWILEGGTEKDQWCDSLRDGGREDGTRVSTAASTWKDPSTLDYTHTHTHTHSVSENPAWRRRRESSRMMESDDTFSFFLSSPVFYRLVAQSPPILLFFFFFSF
jgi:hypothetical protein